MQWVLFRILDTILIDSLGPFWLDGWIFHQLERLDFTSVRHMRACAKINEITDSVDRSELIILDFGWDEVLFVWILIEQVHGLLFG